MSAKRPNILFIMCDQLRVDALGSGCGGGQFGATPAIDAIAAEGTRFTCAYTNSPVCIPARISLATGLYPHNHGFWDNQPMGPQGDRLKAEGYRHTLDPEWPTWMAAIRDSGYRTALVGKTHLHEHYGDLREREHLLHAYGIDDVDEIGGPRASQRVLSHMTQRWDDQGLWDTYKEDYRKRFAETVPPHWPSPMPLPEYADTYVGQRSVEWLQNYNEDKPWMLWASFGGPHEPWDAPEPYASMHEQADFPGPLPQPEYFQSLPEGAVLKEKAAMFADRFDHPKGLPKEKARPLQVNYTGNVTLIDEQVGQLLAAVKARGEWDNTVIVFTADHGEMNGDFGMLTKSNFLEPSCQIPMIVRTPESLVRGGGGVCPHPIELMDVGATLVAAAGAAWDAPHFSVDQGQSVADPSHASRETALAGFGGESLLVTERFKCHFMKTGEPYLLTDRQQDPNEQVNLVNDSAYGAVKADMMLGLLQHQHRSHLHQPGPRLYSRFIN